MKKRWYQYSKQKNIEFKGLLSYGVAGLCGCYTSETWPLVISISGIREKIWTVFERTVVSHAHDNKQKKKHCSREQFFQLERYKGFLGRWGWNPFCISRSTAKSKTRTFNSNPGFSYNQTQPSFNCHHELRKLDRTESG